MMKQIITTFLLLHVVLINSQDRKNSGNFNARLNRFNRQTNDGAQEIGNRLMSTIRTAKTAMTDNSSNVKNLHKENERDEAVAPSTNDKEVDTNNIQSISSVVTTIAPMATNYTPTNVNITDEAFPDRVGNPVIISLQGRK